MRDPTFPKCFGPYLQYGIKTGFAYFTMGGLQRIASKRLALLVELKAAGAKTGFKDLWRLKRMLKSNNVVSSSVREGSRYLVVYVPPDWVDGTVDLKAFWDCWCDRVELSLPVSPNPGARDFLDVTPPQSKNSLLMGIIDDGCPFAHVALQHRDGTTGTRVLALWDQNDRPVVEDPSSGDLFGPGLPRLKYGLEFWRDTVQPGQGGSAVRLLGMNDWMVLHAGQGAVHEQACYQNAGFKSLDKQVAHGAHVMDLMAGNMPPASRMGPLELNADRRDPPSWSQGGAAATPPDPAGDADIVFVQIPQAAIDDATGNWLPTHAMAGLEYIMSFARPGVTRHVVVTMSYGPTTGPHDGHSLLEDALADVVAYYDGSAGKPRLDLVLASGNAYRSAGHVSFLAEPGSTTEWHWRVPPDNPVPCMAEIWLDASDAAHATVTLIPPGVSALAPVTTTQTVNNSCMHLFAVAPTIDQPRHAASPVLNGYVPAAHGEWTMQIRIDAAAPRPVAVSAYTARTDPNMQAATGARSSMFVDRGWETAHANSASQTLLDGESSTAGSRVDRTGTLNGIATGSVPRLHVAGAYKVSDGRKSPYASAGPSRAASAPRQGPDLALPCDESDALPGVLAGGTRSGSVLRMVGTSTAAPQLARFLARELEGQVALPTPRNPGGVPEPARRGAGNLPAP